MSYKFEDDVYCAGKIINSPDFPFQVFEDAFRDKDGKLDPERAGGMHRWHRIFIAVNQTKATLSGPTLDVASGVATFYRGIKNLFPNLLPYSVTELRTQQLSVDGDNIDCYGFECEKNRAPFKNESFGTLFFCDVLEHLVVDPMWTLLEFNRITAMNGHVIISTPNNLCLQRVYRLLHGVNPNTEVEYKPCSIYQRHNREWTPGEVHRALELAGYETIWLNTFPDILGDNVKDLGIRLKELGHLHISEMLLGPEIIIVAKKIRDVNLDQDLDKDTRWPTFLYTGYDQYRKRPSQFPIVIGDDYS